MGFGIREKSDNDNFDSKYTKGVYVEKCMIEEVVNVPSEYNDCNIFITASDINKPDFKYKWYIGGNHFKVRDTFDSWGEYDGPKKVDGIGSWTVETFLLQLGCDLSVETVINADGTIHESIFEDMLGRHITILRYDSNGKYKKSVWYTFASASDPDGETKLRDKFDKRLKGRGVKDYLHTETFSHSNKKLNAAMNNLPTESTQLDDSLDFLK
tara:strand:+ start:3639 stop:4274 length:636 start_codon:yes stop_codon:yes gene_type:complete